MGRQQDAGIAFGEIHLNHGASILNRLFARVDGRGIIASCKIAATRGTNDTLSSQLGNWESPARAIVWTTKIYKFCESGAAHQFRKIYDFC